MRNHRVGWGIGVVAALAATQACSDDTATTSTTSSGSTSSGTSTSTTMSSSTGTNTGSSTTTGIGGMGGMGTGGMASTTNSSSTGVPSECATQTDCDTLYGAAPCDAWACNMGQCEANSPGCTDADQDGYGVGPNCKCAGIDCDDNDDTIQGHSVTSCYSGKAGTAGVGVCTAGSQTCDNGVLSACVGEVDPSAEACNGQDDDCNGAVDDNLGMLTCGVGQCKAMVAACTGGVVQKCTPGMPAALDGPTCNNLDDDCDGTVDEDCSMCIPVSLGGNDATADGTFSLPFQTVQAAINWAATHAGGPQRVCVASGATCGGNGTYQNANGQTITMADGISVGGNYESTTWSHCAAATNTTTTLQPRTPEGVTFPATVMKATSLSDFKVDRFNAGSGMTTAAVTINGSKAATLSHITITNAPNVGTSFGVNIINGGNAVITQSRVDGGAGTALTVGVRVVGSTVDVINNCQTIDANGRCSTGCGNNPSIRGRSNGTGGEAYGIYLQDAQGSTVETSAVCSFNGDNGAAIRIAGNGANETIRESNVIAFNGTTTSHGIWAEDCMDASPWIVDNFNVQANGANANTAVDGIHAIGACHPIIDSNVRIVGGGEGMSSSPTAVHCGANAQGVASQCVVVGNKQIAGSINGFPPMATGVKCDLDGCARVSNNTITGRGGVQAYGLWLENTTAVVDSNLIAGGCAGIAVGIHADNAAARLTNNRVTGYDGCTGGNPAPNLTISRGAEIRVSSLLNEIDVNSNDFDGTGSNAMTVTSTAIDFGASAMAPSVGIGIFRNNILRAGNGGKARYDFAEASATTDPRVFENNDLDIYGTPTALYFDEGMTSLNAIGGVNGLTDMTVSANISADPAFFNYPNDLHLTGTSPCVGAATPTGGPPKDFEGTARDPAKPDIGADEN